MAGVGFELKKLFSARTAAGHIRAYSYSAVITAGPFALMTAMVLAVQMLFIIYGVSDESSSIFVASVVYAFVFSQSLSSGVAMVRSRYRAVCLSLDWDRCNSRRGILLWETSAALDKAFGISVFCAASFGLDRKRVPIRREEIQEADR